MTTSCVDGCVYFMTVRNRKIRWFWLGAAAVFLIPLWKRDGPIAVALSLLGALALIAVAELRARRRRNESNTSGNPGDE
jgi:hypothetical protein